MANNSGWVCEKCGDVATGDLCRGCGNLRPPVQPYTEQATPYTVSLTSASSPTTPLTRRHIWILVHTATIGLMILMFVFRLAIWPILLIVAIALLPNTIQLIRVFVIQRRVGR